MQQKSCSGTLGGNRGTLRCALPVARASRPRGAQGGLVAPNPSRHVGFVQVLYLIPVRSTVRLRQQGEEKELPSLRRPFR